MKTPRPHRGVNGPGLAKAWRGSAFVDDRRLAISRHAEEALFASAEILCEGDLGPARYFGSTLFTFQLAAVRAAVRNLDDAVMNQFCDLVEGSVRVRLRAMRMACADAARRVPDRRLDTARIETRWRRDGDRLHLDVDLEAPVDVSSREKQW